MGLNISEILIWWAALEIIGFLALPVASHICRGLKDHGYSASKPLGLLILTYICWTLSFFSGYSISVILFSIGILAAGSLIIYWKKGISFDPEYVIEFEILFFLGFLAFVIIRAFSPEISMMGGEKFMDMAFINSILRTSFFPPFDPWMSGMVMQYYYFGYLIVANLIKLTGIFPSTAFNLATASFFALSLTTAFGIGYNLTERARYGILSAFFVTIAGNLVGFFQLMDILMKGDILNNILSFNYWTSSRVIPDTINEFPFFSFLQGDVHAHMVSITFQLLIILLLLNVVISGIKDKIMVVILGLSIGFLYPLNTWDYPVYIFITIIVIIFPSIKSGNFSSCHKRNIMNSILLAGSIALLSYLLYLPYHLTYELDRSVSIVHAGRSSLLFYLAFYGLFLYLIYRFVVASYDKTGIKPVHFVITLFLLAIMSFELKFELLVLLIPLLFLSMFSIIKEQDKNSVFMLVLIITGILISLFCELFYVQDAIGIGNPALIRMNTVFKLYISNWILWAVPSVYIVFYFRDSFSRKKTWGIVAIILILMVSVYPIFATIGKSEGFKGTPTLDGEAYVRKEHPREYEAIFWFRNIAGQPVVLQAPGSSFSWNTYITVFTGLPAVIGWAGHEITWRTDGMEIIERGADADKIYTSPDLEEVSALLQKYNVSYIYFGEAEARKYGSAKVFDAHPQRFEKVFEFDVVIVYKVNHIL
jgi:YYY domain-containing protein